MPRITAGSSRSKGVVEYLRPDSPLHLYQPHFLFFDSQGQQGGAPRGCAGALQRVSTRIHIGIMLQRLDLLADCAQVLLTQLITEVNAAMPGIQRNHFWQHLWLGQRKFLHSRHPSQWAAAVLFASARARASVCLISFCSQVCRRPELFIGEGRGQKGTYRKWLIFLLVWVNALALREGHPIRAAGRARTASMLLRARP